MMRASVAGASVLCLALAACGGADRRNENAGAAEGEKTAETRPANITETGCLTARGDQFVLTDLEREGAASTTETYQLVGNDQELRQHVGKQVRVSGEAEAPKVAVVKESTPPTASEPAGTSGAAQPKVSTETQTRVEVRKLTVGSVQPTGQSCGAETKSGEAAPTRQPRQ